MIAVVGLSHRTAPIALRERISFDADATAALLLELHRTGRVTEVMLVSTCNRTELLAAADNDEDPAQLTQRLSEVFFRRLPEVSDHLYAHTGAGAVQHVFRVVSSLDSLVIGEPQILGQFKEAFDLACRQGTVGNRLHRVVTRALRTAKRVRHETQVGAGQVSIPTVALDLARQIFGEMTGHTVVLLGTGEMGELVARLLIQSGAHLIVVGRNAARLGEMQHRYAAEARNLDALEASLAEADIVVCSTSSPVPLIEAAMLRGVMKKRRGRDLFIIDVAVPRDVNVDVDRLSGVYRYDVDDLAAVVTRSLGSREREADRAETIIHEEVQRFERWVEAEQVTPLVRSLRQHIGGVLHRELGKTLRGRLRHLPDPDRAHLEKMVEAAVNKLLHGPTVQLRKTAAESPEDLEQITALLEEMFELSAESHDSDPSSAPSTRQSEAPGSGAIAEDRHP